MKDKKENKEVVIMFKGKPFKVPPGGSLGILALGNIGVRAWKKAKKEYQESQKDGE